MTTFDRIAMIVTVCAFAFLGVASRCQAKGQKIWTKTNLVYTLIAALLTALVLHLLGINP